MRLIRCIIPALVFIYEIIKAADDGKITVREVYEAAKKACVSAGLEISGG
jgi:hypothetical protein